MPSTKLQSPAVAVPARQQTTSAVRGTTYLQRFTVAYEYPVIFTRDALKTANTLLVDNIRRLEPHRRHRVFVVLDSGVDDGWPRLIDELDHYTRFHDASLELAAVERVPGGERAKATADHAATLQRRLYEHSIDRQSVVLVIGGGAVQDVAGFAAATAHRGIRLVRMPTTVGSQNDSGVGVKNGINAFGIKNFLGTFAAPFAVINDSVLLETLPRRERVAGMSEAVKVALIRDAYFFDWLCENRGALVRFETDAVDVMIRRSAELHLSHIAAGGDPFESGNAKPLDFGHWAAHKIESLSDHEVRHGEAVAIGIALDCRYAVESGLLAEGVCERICNLLEDLGFVLWHGTMAERDATGRLWLFDGITEFREHLGGDLTLTMLAAVGVAHDVHEVDPALMESAVAWLECRHRRR